MATRGPRKKIAPVYRAFGSVEVVGTAPDSVTWEFYAHTSKNDPENKDSVDSTLLDTFTFEGDRDEALMFLGGKSTQDISAALVSAKSRLQSELTVVDQQIALLVQMK